MSTRLSRKGFLAILLLMAGIERNPGPANTDTTMSMGLINARSMVNKSALIHDLFNDHHLDVLAVTETWVYENSPDVHKREAAPQGYSIVHAHRSTMTGGGRRKHGGGVALIHREDIQTKVIPAPIATLTFEVLLVKVINSTVGLIIAVIYRPAGSTSTADFMTELSDLIDSGILGSRCYILDDLNCPGPTGSKGLVDKEPTDLTDAYSLTQHVHCPTHQSGNILDHILSLDYTGPAHDAVVIDTCLFDHYLAKYKSIGNP